MQMQHIDARLLNKSLASVTVALQRLTNHDSSGRKCDTHVSKDSACLLLKRTSVTGIMLLTIGNITDFEYLASDCVVRFPRHLNGIS
jgi:hypothetical protein